MNDWELIQNYCRSGSESAFETLVKRHVDYVYCAALRQVRDPSLAEDVSQTVFLLLAQKAKTFGPGTILVSWLFRSTQNIAARALRSESRRQRRELEAAKMNPTTTMPDPEHQWERVSPVLDEALAALPSKDRDAVLLRFISRKPFSQVGAELGTSEDAAKKRVIRALARLRQFFLRRGTTLSVAVIATVLSERAVQASPAVLTAKITGAIGAGASASTPTAVLLKATLRDLFWNKVKWGASISAGVMTLLLLVSTSIRSAHSATTISAPLAAMVQQPTTTDSKPIAAENLTANESATNHTLSLLIVRTEDQQPVPGARVLVDCWTTSMKRMLDATTDTNGILNIPVPTQAFNVLNVWVSAEGRVPMVMSWHAHEFSDQILSHTVSLEPGQTASGTVLDEAGTPIVGAKISFSGPGIDGAKRDNEEFHPQLSASLTDANGRWKTTQLPPKGGATLRVESSDYTPAETWVNGMKGFPTNATLVLSNGVALTGQITTADGKPVPKARVAKQSGVYFSTKTDAEGVFHWPHIEPGQVFVDVTAEGFETIHEFAWATNSANECTFILTPTSDAATSAASAASEIRLHGTVVDSYTGEPILSFRVLSGDAFMSPTFREDVVLSNPQLLGEGRDGRFDWPNLNRNSFHARLQVEADGYLESVSDERAYNDWDREFTFKLRRAAMLTGQVLTPDGSAVEDAIVSLTGAGIGPVMQAPGKLLEPNPGFGDTRTQTDHEGKFRLKLKLGARGVAVVHESGSALLTFAASTNAPIVLRPWGAIDGMLYLNGQPASNQTVYVNGTQKLDADPKVMFSSGYTTSTDGQGHFHFDKVLPGEHTVSREVGYSGGGMGVIVNFDLDTKVKVESGQVASVELRRAGRLVIGRIVFQGTPDDIHWETSEASLQSTNKFPFILSKGGSIRADDVPPGTYTLSIHLDAATASAQPYSAKPFGSLQKEIVVPTAEDESVPVNLGELTITPAK